MGMKLAAGDLREIADTVDKIQQAGLKVEVVEVRGHKIVLKRTDSQHDGLEYFVVGVADGELSVGQASKILRDAEADGRKPDMGHLPGRTPLGRSSRR